MSQLPPLKPKKVMQALRKAGYYQDHVRGSHSLPITAQGQLEH